MSLFEDEDLFFEDQEPIEDDTDIEKILTDDLSNAIIQSTDWTTETLLNQIEKERIILNPKFQRRDAWNLRKKSKFIESLILGFPVPQIVLAESNDQRGKYLIIDGKQRLLSITQFACIQKFIEKNKPFRLDGLEILEDYNDKSLEELRLNKKYAAGLEEFDNRTIRTVVIRHWQYEAVLYHIFLRLNTESVQLSPQELRNALHPGAFAEYIDDYSGKSKALRKIFKSNKPDFRMRDAELLLRYYAFRNFITLYAGSMKIFLDNTTKKLNESWKEKEELIKKQADEFELSVDLAFKIFGDENAFRRWKSGGFIGRFNRAVFDVIIFHLYEKEIQEKLLSNKDKIKTGYMELCNNNQKFIDAIEVTTKSLNATCNRLSIWTETLNDILEIEIPIPKLVQNRIKFSN